MDARIKSGHDVYSETILLWRMTDQQFHTAATELSVADIARLTGAALPSGEFPDCRIARIAALDRAGPGDLAFFDNARFADQFAATRAGVCLVSPRFAPTAPGRSVVLVVQDPYRAFVMVARQLFPSALRPSSLFAAEGLAPGATVHPSARLEADIRIDPGAVIGPRAEIGEGTVIGAGAAVGPDVRIGRECAIGAGVTLTNALLGDRVVIHPGCRIGQDGFGYVPSPQGHQKVPQVGRVIIQDEVEIGANCTIDRGASRDTVVGEGTKIDNLVQIGHNVTIGRHCLIVAQCGISGSVTLGDFVVLGGQVGVADRITIGEGAQVGAQSGVIGDIPAGERWFGYPAMHGRDYLRRLANRRDRTGERASRAADE